MSDEEAILIFVLPGGKMPSQQTPGSVGYDVHARAVVSPFEMDSKHPQLRKTLFNFLDMPDDLAIRSHVELLPKYGLDEDGGVRDNKFELVWRLDPHGDRVLIGAGFALNMPLDRFQWVTPRSGLSSKYGVNLGNAPGTVDSDYRGEAGLIVVNNGDTPIYITHQMRIAQTMFQRVYAHELVEVPSFEALGETTRGAGGFGSTGYT